MIVNDSPRDNTEINVPGYTLVDRIGAGGYGEVWLANAPGGLTKAVKVIYGYHNEKRAARELSSLSKIKEARHPFLLSLERIEVIEGRLIIVSELADASLKDRYEACQKEGLPGVPRKELLSYLREAADALDFLNDKYSLQHLDIKPENLLLLSGHVKVADFGLVKEVHESQPSLVGGMTPLYSAPEVFQGRPSAFSDQYSLAILYQEVLTGKLPFSGVTSAELTLQHMHDEPDLSPLPMGDRYVLARALSKTPESRFPSCSEMLEALIAVETESAPDLEGSITSAKQPTAERRPFVASPRESQGNATQAFEEEANEEISHSMLLEKPIPQESISSTLPPQILSRDDYEAVPTLLIGIGGTAGKVLQKYKQQVCSRHGNLNEMPAMPLLLLDTDPKALVDLARDDETGLTKEETLNLALRRPQDYRDRSQGLMQWLSRRWLYNIPRSLRTEGLRPLGRLAFVDHARRTLQRIRMAISQATDPESVQKSAQNAGLSFSGNELRVYVVSSISGGTGSGMSLDVGFAVRALLQKLGIENASTIGLFLSSTGRDSRTSDLAKVNAHAWLKEYHHFHREGGFYPGDEASGLPAQEPGVRAFDSTYLVDLGNKLSEQQLEEQIEVIAEYLYLNTWTSAQQFFNSCRLEDQSNNSGQVTLRTFGMNKVSNTPIQLIERLTNRLCHYVVKCWSGERPDPNEEFFYSAAPLDLEQSSVDTVPLGDTEHVDCGMAQAVAKFQIDLDGIAANAQELVHRQFGSKPENVLSNLLSGLSKEGQKVKYTTAVKAIDGMFAHNGVEEDEELHVLGRPLHAIVSPLSMNLAGEIQRWMLNRLDDRQQRLSGTLEAADWFAKHYEKVESDAKKIARGIQQKVADIAESCKVQEQADKLNQLKTNQLLVESCQDYLRMRLDLCALQASCLITRMLQAELKDLRESVLEFGRHLRKLGEGLAVDFPYGGNVNGDVWQDEEQRQLEMMMTKHLFAFVPDIDQKIQNDFINLQGGIFNAFMSSVKVVASLKSLLKKTSREQVEILARKMNTNSNQAADLASKSDQLDVSEPELLKYGGTTRFLVSSTDLGESAEHQEQLSQIWGERTSLAFNNNGEQIICCEAGGMELSPIAVDLIECRKDYAEFASRVHTRNDISWSPLVDVTVPVIPENVSATQVL